MNYPECFSSLEDSGKLLEDLSFMASRLGPVSLMEICGTHTMAIAGCGLKQLLPKEVRLISGPGCPVCVTPSGAIDEILRISEDPRVIIASYGDLLRVPGSRPGDSLLRRKALGAQVKMVYSPMDALRLAKEQPKHQVLFLGAGFETTAPGTAACLLEARELGLSNFFVLSLLKTTMPAIRSLSSSPVLNVHGFLCPGHVAVITGSQAFAFLPEEFGLPAVVSGFEPADLLVSVWSLVRMLYEKKPALKNEYTRLVRPEGNPAALAAIHQVFHPCESLWRGLGMIPESGLAIREEFSRWDGAKAFGFSPEAGKEPPGCRCGDVIRGLLEPADCPLFGSACTPQDPAGPCMVSSEGACAAAFRYPQLKL